MGQKLKDCAIFGGGAAGSPSNTMQPGPRPTSVQKCHLDPSSRLATIHSPKSGGLLSPVLSGDLGPHLTQCRLAEAYLHTKWHPDSSSNFVTTDTGRKLGAVRFFGGSWVPHVAWTEACLRTKWHLHPSSRLATIHGPKNGGAFQFLWGERSWDPI